MLSIVPITLILLITCGSSTMGGLNTSNNWEKAMAGNSEISEALSSLNIANLPGDFAVRQSSALKMFAGGVNTILGFGSSILTFVGFFISFLGEAPKYSIDDVMNQLNTQFADVKNQLSVIYNKMQKQDIDAYRAVEDAVTAANSDIRLGNTLDLTTRGLRLCDQLFTFSKGMLGQNGFSADILQVTTDLLKCASTSIYNQMQKYINLVNIGGLGLGYYGKQIGDAFNLNARAKMLDGMKSEILTRTNAFMTNCQTFTLDKVNNYITTILSSLQNSNSNDVAQALYNYLDDVYNKKKNFIFYVAQNFDSRNKVKFGYWGGGLQGNIANGVWTVYWAATPIWPEHDIQQLNVDSTKLLNTLTDAIDANDVYSKIQWSAISGRKTGLTVVVLYNTWALQSSASVGNPPRLNTYYNRFSIKLSTRVSGLRFPIMRPWTIDIIVQ